MAEVTKKTVFVVGAGASCEFGLPSGLGLKKQISSLLKRGDSNVDPVLYEALERVAYSNGGGVRSPVAFVNAARAISSSLPLAPSIDNYLHTHNADKVVEKVGKLAIVHSILTAERKSKLFFKPSQNHEFDFAGVENSWLAKLMQLLNEHSDIDELKKRLSSLVFIVFNYDRCIEHFLFNAIRVYYRVEADVAATIVQGITIFHPYGTVGEYPFSLSSYPAGTAFGADPEAQRLVHVAEGIKTFTEGTDDENSDIIAIRRHIVEASRLVFLGFAFHPINMELLTGKTPERRTNVSIE